MKKKVMAKKGSAGKRPMRGGKSTSSMKMSMDDVKGGKGKKGKKGMY